MTIQEMHKYFRQYAQKMGMQNVRAIIPEQIDIFLNTSISDIVNQLVRDNSGLIKDKATADLSKISQPNALNSLYKIQETNFKELGNFPNPIKTSVSLVAEDYLYITDIAINYITEAGDETRYFPVKIIDAANFAETLNDPILKPKINKPIAVINNDDLEIIVNNLVLTNIIFQHSIKPKLNFLNLRTSYIKKPVIVKYDKENVNSVNCDLPESLHIDVIKHAVELYKTAINDKSSIMYVPQQQPQQPTRQ
jgi:hypothetical protein